MRPARMVRRHDDAPHPDPVSERAFAWRKPAMKDDVVRRPPPSDAAPRARASGGRIGSIDARAAVVAILAVAGLVILLWLLRAGLPEDWADRLQTGFADARAHAWAFPAVVAAFTLLAFVGAPQFLLIGATVAVFGPVEGALYAWAATMSGAAATFYAGRAAGGRALRRFGGPRLNALSAWLARRGTLSSALIRITPSAPFAVVNACAGASRIRAWKFFLGTGLGVVPKILTIAFLGAGVTGWAAGGGVAAAGFAVLAAFGWIALLAVGRRAAGEIPEKSIEIESVSSFGAELDGPDSML